MPTATFDGQSFLLDGRRLWIVAGAVQYSMIAREMWPEAIRLAKQAGFNTIDTSVVWSRHEPRPGHFDFTGASDLRHFVQLAGAAGLNVMLRVGPYVGGGFDFGGLPAWLQGVTNLQLRTANGPFLEAASRFLTAVVEQVRDLQATGPKGGPVLLVQAESHWTCGHDELAEKYLGEINRYLREGGLTVPIIASNNLWAHVEGVIDAWSATSGRLLATCRELATARPTHPRLVLDVPAGSARAWGREPGAGLDPLALQRSLAEIIAGGAQFGLGAFHAGVHFGFDAGQLDPASGEAGFACASPIGGAPVGEDGTPGASFEIVRRLATFSSRFARVLSNLDAATRGVVADPQGDVCSVVPLAGSQGGVVFVFGPAGRASGGRATLLLPDGQSLGVDLGGQGVGWYLMGASLTGRSTLDWCNLNAFALVGKVLVCFGPKGFAGRVSINGSPIDVAVPTGAAPVVVEHEGVVLVVCAEEQVASVQAGDDAVFFPATGLTRAGDPILPDGVRRCTKISGAGETTTVTQRGDVRHKGAGRDTLSNWAAAPASEHQSGTSARFASIEKPTDLTSMGSPYGYGWYRAVVTSASARRATVMMPHSGDRLHLFVGGHRAGVVGVGPGASRWADLRLSRGENTLVILADNLGRASAGASLGERKGLFGPMYEARPIRAPKPAARAADPINILSFRAPLWGVQRDETTQARRLSWTLPKGKRLGVIVDVRSPGVRALLVVNDAPVAFLERDADTQVFVESARLGRGSPRFELAFLHEAGDDLDLGSIASSFSFFAAVSDVSAKAPWAFARWEPPPASAYAEAAKGAGERRPTWWRGTLRVGEVGRGRFLDLAGLSKGQCYINARHLGRYFVGVPSGGGVKRVGPQDHLFVPPSWLREGENEVLLFDEHGASPSRVRARPAGAPS